MKLPIHFATMALVLASLSACAGEDVVQSEKNIEIVETDGYADAFDNELLQADERDAGNLNQEKR